MHAHASFLGLCCTVQVALEEFHSPGGQAQVNDPPEVIPDFLLSDMCDDHVDVDQPDIRVVLGKWFSIFSKMALTYSAVPSYTLKF